MVAVEQEVYVDEPNKLHHVRALFAQYKPGVAVSRLAREAGIKPHVLERVFKKDSLTYQTMPNALVAQDIAKALGCHDVNEVLEAFDADLDPNGAQARAAARQAAAVPREVAAVVMELPTEEQGKVLAYAKELRARHTRETSA